MNKYGLLLGLNMNHSLSPELHSCFGDYSYELFNRSEADAAEFIKHGDFKGINVTIPYKKLAASLVNHLDPVSEATGSVNTVLRCGSITYGYNTDVYGFIYMCRKAGIDIKGKSCAVLGNGGVAPSVRYALNELGASEIITVSGRSFPSYSDIDAFSHVNIIVNATPVGMYPKNDESIIDIRDSFPGLYACIDLIYNPFDTLFLKMAEIRGIKYTNGLNMLVGQGVKASEIFTGVKISETQYDNAYNLLKSKLSL